MVTLKPTLSVNNAEDMDDDPITYEFELYADENLTEKVASATLYEGELITAWRVGTELEDNRTYYWRARSYDGKLKSNWMTTAMFVLDTEGVETKVVLVTAQDVSLSEQTTQKVVVSDTNSPLEGVSIEIPPGALKEDLTITIGEVINPPALPDNLKAIGKVIDYGPHGTTFNTPVTVRVPYTYGDLYGSGVSDPAELEVWTFNTTTLAWEAVPVDRVEGWFLVYELSHFSIYATGKPVATTPSSGIPADPAAVDGGGGGGGGCFIATLAGGGYPVFPLVLLVSIFLAVGFWRSREKK